MGVKSALSKWAITIAAVGLMPQAWALKHEVSLDVGVQKASQPKTSKEQSTEHFISTVAYRMDGIKSYYGFLGSVSVERSNLTKVYVMDDQGNSYSLATVYGDAPIRATGEVGGIYKHGDIAITASVLGTLSTTPYPYTGVSFEMENAFAEKTSILRSNLTLIRNYQPRSYFLKRNLKSGERPTVIDSSESKIYFEQILSDRHKAFVEVATALQDPERPRRYGGRLGTNHALWTWGYIQFQGSAHREFTDVPLAQTERGHMEKYSGEFILTVEPFYDVLLSMGYGHIWEKEEWTDPSLEEEVQTNQVGLGLSFNLFGALDVGAKGAAYFPSNGSMGYSASVTLKGKI